jgi:hypothetical protein
LRRLVVAVLIGLAACGIPTDDEPQRVRDSDVPFGLLETSTTVAPTTVTKP